MLSIDIASKYLNANPRLLFGQISICVFGLYAFGLAGLIFLVFCHFMLKKYNILDTPIIPQTLIYIAKLSFDFVILFGLFRYLGFDLYVVSIFLVFWLIWCIFIHIYADSYRIISGYTLFRLMVIIN